jgi:hypothetical protein
LIANLSRLQKLGASVGATILFLERIPEGALFSPGLEDIKQVDVRCGKVEKKYRSFGQYKF